MPLTAEQRITLAAHIRANQSSEVIAALVGRNDSELARLYNLPSTFIIWRENIRPDEYREAIVWTEVDGLTAGKARIWEWISQNMTANLNASKAGVRQGIADAFVAGSGTRNGLLAVAKQAASIAEAVFATGTGTNAVPGVRTFVGVVTTEDIGRALNEGV